MTATLSRAQRARRVRYAIAIALFAAHKPMTIAELCWAVAYEGIDLGPNPNKRVSDALRWEMDHGRAHKVRRGVYVAGRMPPTTKQWMLQESARIRTGPIR